MNEQQRLRRHISAVQFAMWELQLYDKLTAEYEKAYGPLNETSRSTSRWAWISDPWPWETEANE